MKNDCPCYGECSLVRKPEGDPLSEFTEGLTAVYINQTTNGGYYGDDFAGTMFIELKSNLWLKSHYSC